MTPEQEKTIREKAATDRTDPLWRHTVSEVRLLLEEIDRLRTRLDALAGPIEDLADVNVESAEDFSPGDPGYALSVAATAVGDAWIRGKLGR